jgi:hypothetical protein
MMTVEYIDGIKVMRLHDLTGTGGRAKDMAMLHIWQMLTGGHAMRDAGLFCRSF